MGPRYDLLGLLSIALGMTWNPIWDPNLGPRFGTPIWDPDLGPRFGTLIWDPNFGPPI
jgi:hypothetical protein